MKSPRWTEITESPYPWERQALDYLRSRLPDTEPFHAWSNFECVGTDGSIDEVDRQSLVYAAPELIGGRAFDGEKLALLTADEIVRAYEVRTIDASA